MTWAFLDAAFGARRRNSMKRDDDSKTLSTASSRSSLSATTPATSTPGTTSPSSPGSMVAATEATVDEDATEQRLALDIAQLMRHDSEYSPKDVADFLHQLPHLDPKMVGRVLGEPDEFALTVLQEYANGFVFKDYGFDVSLRVYLGRFVVPGEAQKIDRVLQAFAKAYFAANPRDKFCPSEEAVYTLAFSVVLLNTDAHNPHLAQRFKMRKDDFIRNHQGVVLEGKGVPREFLARCFDSFVGHPIRMIPRKRATMLPDELELTFDEGPLGLDIETSLDTRTCIVKKYARLHRHIYATVDSIPDLGGYVIVAVADDSTQQIGYALTRYLLKTASRPVTIRFCEPSIYFASIAS
ncbi:hypothetical protein Poli38472_003960 [Pythium oligandrum]|uniref:SEC7 domain-containing protein n=1 Tax=Pythium oligandrum TaxID=41045 RepID=A0A8K1FJL7_PYTOL|nr:hypothetical protein Poli38472_003960 [Pythium oligandrum]|eukprot:TMW66195.1 hypothetical protein Poli38472_003960 [Pythium oligandrum]